MSDLLLVIGNRNYSSWSLRAWLAMKIAGLEFAEEIIPLDLENTKERLAKSSPAGRVPTLRVLGDGDGAPDKLVVWESLAIIEYLAETYPQARWWPEDANVRAVARAVSAEMHSSFATMRAQIPMNVRATGRNVPLTETSQKNVARILKIWTDCRRQYGQGGDFLFGEICAADAMFAPIVVRFLVYGIEMDDVTSAYADAVWNSEHMKWWRAAAEEESWTIPDEEVGLAD